MPNLKGFNNKENSNLPPTELVMSDSVEPLIGSQSQGARDKLSEVVRSSLVINNNYYKYNYWGDDSLIHPDNMATPDDDSTNTCSLPYQQQNAPTAEEIQSGHGTMTTEGSESVRVNTNGHGMAPMMDYVDENKTTSEMVEIGRAHV